MSIAAININSTEDYISKYDQDKKNPTIWKLGFLDPIIKAEIDDDVTVFEADVKNPEGRPKTSLKLNSSRIKLVKFGLKGVDNFNDPETGKLISFDTVSTPVGGKNYNLVSDNFLRYIPLKVIYELADRIKGIDELTEEERKN